MKTRNTKRESTTDPGDIRLLTSLAAALRIVGIVNELRLHEQSLTVTLTGRQSFEIDFRGRVPFSFAFTAGHEASFRVPRGHRFLIEHVSLSSTPKHDALEVQMVTRSAQMFRQQTLACNREIESNSDKPGAFHSIVVHGSTANTLLFSNGAEQSSSTVPPDTYVQVWGCLEATDDETSL